MTTIALDAMGGDLGLTATVEGAARLSKEPTDIRVMLVGDGKAISERLRKLSYDPRRIELVDSSGCVGMDEDPRRALDEKPNCSVLVASALVASGDADALVSAGNTGGTILASARTFNRIPGIRRAALAAVYPTEQRHGPKKDPFALMLDVGATLHAEEQDLVGFAVMGSAYSSVISEILEPRVALLSNGTEPNKGTAAIKAAHKRLVDGPLNFAGNVEGLDIARGTVDVIVCDGFLGNVVLKMLEGVGEVFKDVAKQASGRKLQWKVGMAMLGGGLRRIRRMTDWKAYGGAPLLGLDHVVIKAHGRSEARAIRNAVKVAAKAADGGLIKKIQTGSAALGLSDDASQ